MRRAKEELFPRRIELGDRALFGGEATHRGGEHTFEERDGATTMTTVSRFGSVADRDGMAASGMEEGARGSLDRLAELLATL